MNVIQALIEYVDFQGLLREEQYLKLVELGFIDDPFLDYYDADELDDVDEHYNEDDEYDEYWEHQDENIYLQKLFVAPNSARFRHHKHNVKNRGKKRKNNRQKVKQ